MVSYTQRVLYSSHGKDTYHNCVITLVHWGCRCYVALRISQARLTIVPGYLSLKKKKKDNKFVILGLWFSKFKLEQLFNEDFESLRVIMKMVTLNCVLSITTVKALHGLFGFTSWGFFLYVLLFCLLVICVRGSAFMVHSQAIFISLDISN